MAIWWDPTIKASLEWPPSWLRLTSNLRYLAFPSYKFQTHACIRFSLALRLQYKLFCVRDWLASNNHLLHTPMHCNAVRLQFHGNCEALATSRWQDVPGDTNGPALHLYSARIRPICSIWAINVKHGRRWKGNERDFLQVISQDFALKNFAFFFFFCRWTVDE